MADNPILERLRPIPMPEGTFYYEYGSPSKKETPERYETDHSVGSLLDACVAAKQAMENDR